MSNSKFSGQQIADLLPILRCPVTHEPLRQNDNGDLFPETSKEPVHPSVAGLPVLVDFANSILIRDEMLASDGSSLIGARPKARPFWKRFLLGENKVSPQSAQQMIDDLASVEDPVVLIIGGGRISDSADLFYQAENLRVVAFDVYATAATDFVADGHAVPMASASVDAVWIEAVLEHVLSPHVVADEIWRVLKPHGLLYASTPFLQPVHEKAYDFTRFTESGHRWLFRRFACIDRGVVAGPGSVLFQILRYSLGGALGNRRLGSALAAPFFWLRFFDRLADRRHGSDAASGVYFLGRKSDTELHPRDMPSEFRGVQ